PLEAQAYTGSAGQIFALDGDSIILASDRTQVVEGEKGRGANKTPLALGHRDLDDSEVWTITATDGAARKPTSGFVAVEAAGSPQAQGAMFASAVRRATPGAVIEVAEDVSADLTNQYLLIPAGVTIRGNRRFNLLGPELWTSNEPNGTMLEIGGN